MFNTHILYKGRLKYEFDAQQATVLITYKECGVICDTVVNTYRLPKDSARIRYYQLIQDGYKKK